MVKGHPVLLVPEMLLPPDRPREFDLNAPYFAESYQEMAFYNQVAEGEAKDAARSPAAECLAPAVRLTESEREQFPEPPVVWADAPPESTAQMNALRYIGKVKGTRVLQIGGKGIHAVKCLLGGAEEAWLISPMIGELLFSFALAKHCGVEDRIRCVAGIGEQLPFAPGTFDSIYSGSCIHHTVTEAALPEIARILKPGGKFAAVDPWRTPIYQAGITVFGKREKGVFCKPITAERARPLFSSLTNARLDRHGALTRYPLILMQKAGLNVPLNVAYKILTVDDTLSSFLPPLRRIMGSCVTMLGTR